MFDFSAKKDYNGITTRSILHILTVFMLAYNLHHAYSKQEDI